MLIRTLAIHILLMLSVASGALAAPRADLWSHWGKHDPISTVEVDHAPWGRFLKAYLVTDHPSGINRLRYGAVTLPDRLALTGYLDHLQGINVSSLNRAEQKAYWINLYNGLTVRVVLDHYPVKSIRDIDISPGFFSNGPWDAKLLRIEGINVSLNDIEHRILRPVWRDPRIHYAVNCASIGCPNLQPEPYTANNMENLLEKGAREYVNHPRGARLERNRLVLSSIYNWFQDDFGGNEESVKKHLSRYANRSPALELKKFRGSIKYQYDWTLNE